MYNYIIMTERNVASCFYKDYSLFISKENKKISSLKELRSIALFITRKTADIRNILLRVCLYKFSF